MCGIVLVGGKGTRLRDVVTDIPKPLAKIAGQPFLHWVTRWVAAQGEDHIVLAAFHMAGQLEDWATKEKSSVTLEVAVEPAPLGTGGAAFFAASRSKADHYLVVNGDSLTFVSLQPAHDWINKDPSLDGVIIAKQLEDVSRFGSLDIDSNGLLVGFREKRAGGGWINLGIYLLKPHLLAQKVRPMSMEFDCFPRWLREGVRIGVMTTDADFLDIGTPESLAQATRFIESNRHCLNDPAKLAAVRAYVLSRPA